MDSDAPDADATRKRAHTIGTTEGEVPTHSGVVGGGPGIPAADYWKAIGLYCIIWLILCFVVYAGAAPGQVARDMVPALWGFATGLCLALLEFVVSVKAAVLVGDEDRAVSFYTDRKAKGSSSARGPFETLARRADGISTACFNVASCVITWAVYITTSDRGGGARQLQWNLLSFAVALLAGGTATATGNMASFERSLFARQRALILAISIAVAAVKHAR